MHDTLKPRDTAGDCEGFIFFAKHTLFAMTCLQNENNEQ